MIIGNPDREGRFKTQGSMKKDWNYRGRGGGGHTKELSQKGYGYFVENTIHAYNLLGLNKNI